MAQGIPQGIQDANSMRQLQPKTIYESAPNTAIVIVHVFADEKPALLDRSVRVDITNVGSHLGFFAIVPGHEDAVFLNTILGKYAVSVTAVGYLSTRQEINVLNPIRQDVDIVLHRDPAAISLNEASGVMSSKAKKESNRAVSLLKSGRLADARKHLEKAYELAPSNADLNFLIGYLYFEENDYAQAGTYLRTAASLSPHSAQTLTLLGRTNLAQKNYPAAQSALEQAILVDAENWLPYDLLADSYLHEREYSKARDEAQIAVAKSVRYGKDASGAAELTLGQALLALGQNKEGIQALQAFLKQSPPANLVDQVRALITTAEKSDHAFAPSSEVATPPADPLMAVPKVALSMQTWRPPDIDDVKPTLEPGVSCPSAQVLAGVGQRVEELVQDVTRFAAKEELFHKSIDGAGLSSSAETRKYDYVAAISPERGSVLIDEYHTDRSPQGGDPDGIASTGFVMLALVFHPGMQGDFNFDCEGQGRWHGQSTWLVHFRQRHDRPNHMQTYKVAGNTYRVDLKGRAWIAADSFQIVHVEADMANPVHEIQLLSEHQIVEYGPVPFAKKKTMLWLPKNVEIYFDFRKHRYYRQYNFDDYMLFDVDVSENHKRPPDPSTSGLIRSTEKDPD
jgi:tetratricopeptide (TPR) repeat protein